MTTTGTTPPCTLILMCKRPRPGVGKQRVASATGADVAFELTAHLLDCAFEDLAAWPDAVALSVADAGDADWAARQVPGATVVVQRDGNLGQRLEDTLAQLFDGAARHLFIGMDAPTLTADYLAACRDALATRDVVLGRAEDGGVVVMGSRKSWPPLAGLPWSSSRLGNALAAQCAAHGHTVSWQAPHADIDFADQFGDLASALADDPRPARRALLQWLAQYVDQDIRALARCNALSSL